MKTIHLTKWMSLYVKTVLILIGLIFSKGAFACGITILSQDQTPLNFMSSTGVVKTVLSLKEDCTSINGYVISVSSLNGSNFKSIYASYAYQIKYGGEGPVSLASGWQKTYLGPSVGDTKLLEIVVPPYPLPVAGSYSDTLTLTLSSR